MNFRLVQYSKLPWSPELGYCYRIVNVENRVVGNEGGGIINIKKTTGFVYEL